MKKGKEVTAPPAVRDEEKATAKRPQKEAYDMAIDALVSGESVTNAAALAGVRRETLSRWLHGNPVFIAKYNVKKNEARKESLAGINSIVAQSATALRVALRHPDINPTAVVQSIMSMLPKMYAALLAQGEEETDPLNVMLSEKRRKTLAEWDILSKPLSDMTRAALNTQIEAFNAMLEVEAIDRLRDELPKLHEKRGKRLGELSELCRKQMPEETQITIRR